MSTCPVCNGSTRMPATNLDAYSKEHNWYGYTKEDDSVRCTNCGGQTQSLRATGQVPINKNGYPCVHKYESATIGRCYHEYTCTHCGDQYTIDSGD